jgi:hypothetical protein
LGAQQPAADALLIPDDFLKKPITWGVCSSLKQISKGSNHSGFDTILVQPVRLPGAGFLALARKRMPFVLPP